MADALTDVIVRRVPPFWISIALLSLAQGALVALPGSLSAPWLASLRGRRWAVIPPLSVIAFVFLAREAEHASAQGLTYLALVAVPLLAALALGWLVWDARPWRALLVAPLFALAWLDRGGLAGEAAALILSALSCAALGVLLAAVTPPRWLAAGIVAMAIAERRWWSPICCKSPTTPSTPRIRPLVCRSYRVLCSAQR